MARPSLGKWWGSLFGKNGNEYATASTQTSTPVPDAHQTPVPHGESQTVSLEAFSRRHAIDVETIDDLYYHSIHACSNIFLTLHGLVNVRPKDYLPLPDELSAHVPAGRTINIRTTGFELFMTSSVQFHATVEAKIHLDLVSEKLKQYRKSESDAGECSQSEFEALEHERLKSIDKLNSISIVYNNTFKRQDAFKALYDRQMSKVGVRVHEYDIRTGERKCNTS